VQGGGKCLQADSARTLSHAIYTLHAPFCSQIQCSGLEVIEDVLFFTQAAIFVPFLSILPVSIADNVVQRRKESGWGESLQSQTYTRVALIIQSMETASTNFAVAA